MAVAVAVDWPVSQTTMSRGGVWWWWPWLLVCARARVDDLFHARCSAACDRHQPKAQCESECALTIEKKPGHCPPSPNLIWHERACIQGCTRDVDCEGTDKCCPNPCGVTCQHALGLDQDPALPIVPTNLTVAESKRQRSRLVTWAPSVPPDVVYVLQYRHHAGITLDNKLFGPWKTRSRRPKHRYLLNGLVPGHWYQVRVASVNAHGSRGYSPPSKPFMLNIDPRKPDEPHNLTVLRPGWVDGRLWAELRWKRPISDLPLDHYKIFWSHCVKSEELENLASNSFCKQKSVIVQRKIISYKNTNFILEDLEPQSLYFIQVQAITKAYGKRKLSSDKAAIFIDTNKLSNASYNWKVQAQASLKDLALLKVFHTSSGLVARVVWKATPGRFLVRWSPDASCDSSQRHPSFEATTEQHQYDIEHLNFNCRYQVTVNEVTSSKSARITFKTPLCSKESSTLPCS